MPGPVPDQAPASPFEILGLKESDAIAEKDILDAYAQRACRTMDEIELSVTFRGARDMAIYLQRWRGEFSGHADESTRDHPDALSTKELARHIRDGTAIDLERFRRTPIRTIRAAVETSVWHRSAWNGLVSHQPTEVVATLLEVRSELLALADNPEQLLYELQSDQIAQATKTSFLVQRSAMGALAYLAWVLPEPTAELAPVLVHDPPDENQENLLPNTVILAELAFLLRDQMSGARRIVREKVHLDKTTTPALEHFFEFLHKAPVLSHQLSMPLLQRTAKSIAEHPGLFFTLLFHRKPRALPEIHRPDLDWRNFSPAANHLLSRYITLALSHLSFPLLPTRHIETIHFDDLCHQADETYRWLTHEAPSVNARRLRMGIGLLLPSLSLAAGAAAGFIPLAWGLYASAGLAGIAGATGLFQRWKSRHAAQVAVTALASMQGRIPIPFLVHWAAQTADETNGWHAWLPPVPAPNDPIVLAMDAWDTLITLVARWARHDPTANHRNEQLRNQTDEPSADQSGEPRHQG